MAVTGCPSDERPFSNGTAQSKPETSTTLVSMAKLPIDSAGAIAALRRSHQVQHPLVLSDLPAQLAALAVLSSDLAR